MGSNSANKNCLAGFFKASTRALYALPLFYAASALADSAALKLASRPNLPPYVQDGAQTGIEIDIVKAVFKHAGQPIEFVQMDRVEMISRFEAGGIEGTLTQSTTATNHGCLTKWYLVHQNVGFTILEKEVALTSLPDLGALSVVSFDNAKVFLGKDFRTAVESNPNYKEIAPQSSHIGLLYKGEFDVIFGDEWIIRYVQRQHFEKTGEYQELRVHHIMKPTLYSARFQKQETCDMFNTSLRAIRRSGEYDKIIDGYHYRILLAGNKASAK